MTKTQLKTVVAIVLGAAVGSAVTVGGATAARGINGEAIRNHSIPIAKLTYGAQKWILRKSKAQALRVNGREGCRARQARRVPRPPGPVGPQGSRRQAGHRPRRPRWAAVSRRPHRTAGGSRAFQARRTARPTGATDARPRSSTARGKGRQGPGRLEERRAEKRQQAGDRHVLPAPHGAVAAERRRVRRVGGTGATSAVVRGATSSCRFTVYTLKPDGARVDSPFYIQIT